MDFTILKSYFYAFVHPFKFASYVGHNLRDERQRVEWQSMGLRALQSWESIMVAWGFKILSAIVMLIIFRFGFLLGELHPNLSLSLQSKGFVLYIGFGVVFFPLSVGFSMLIWKFMLRVLLPIFMQDDEVEIFLDQFMAHSFSSYAIIAVPIIGPVLQEILWALFIFAGLRNIYRLSTAQAILIISFFTLLIFLSIASFAMGIITIFSI